MDSLTHVVLGACLGEIIAGKKIGKKAMIIGAIANNIPDIDVITSLWMNQADSLLAHRGFTHSILFAVLATFLISYLAKKYLKSITLSLAEWRIIIGSGLFVHILFDAFTTYGTGWFEPFSHVRVAFNTLFILDPVILFVLLVTALVLLILKRDSSKRNAWARGAIVICVTYLIVAIAIKFFVDNKVEGNISSQNIDAGKYLSTPSPLNNILWYIVVKGREGFYIGYYSLFDYDCPISFEFVAQNDSLQYYLLNDDELQKLMRFSDGYYCFEKKTDTILFNDMRFGQIEGWSKPNAPFVFKFYLNKITANDLVIQRGRMENVNKGVFVSLLNRIKGSCKTE